MKGDFSRLTFDPTKHYSGVRMQQGRVQLDADWNEQMDILMHRLETEVADFIGHSGVPADVNEGKSFQVTVDSDNVQVAPGRIYLAGKLFENASNQRIPPDQLPQVPGEYIAYLDAWQSTVSALEDPAIREVALGGADTTVRVKNVWRVRFLPGAHAPETKPGGTLITTGKLKAQIKATGGALENQLYRVEIHQSGGPNQATYKWSRENGSVATTVESILSPTQIVVSSTGRDSRLGFARDHWVELLTLAQAHQGEAGALIKLQDVEGRMLTLVSELPQAILASQPATSIIVRRWEGMGTIPTDDTWQAIENAIVIAFQSKAEQDQAASYNQGDYWLLPTRALTGKLEGPSDWAGFQPPHGVRHYYAPLALLVRTGRNWKVTDQRTKFTAMDKGFVSKTGDTMTGSLTINDALQVSKDVIIGGSLKPQQANTALQITGPLTVNGLTTLNGGLSVIGVSTMHGDLTVDAGKNVTLGGGLTVSGATILNGLSVTGDLNVAAAKNVILGGSLTISNGLATLRTPTDNGGNTLKGAETALQLYREGVDSQSYPNFVNFNLSRYESGTTFPARTQLDILLGHGSADRDDKVNAVMTLRSNGNVGIGTTKPIQKLHVASLDIENPAYIVLTNTRVGSVQKEAVLPFLSGKNVPDNTLIIAGCYNDSIYFYWKVAEGIFYQVKLDGQRQTL